MNDDAKGISMFNSVQNSRSCSSNVFDPTPQPTKRKRKSKRRFIKTISHPDFFPLPTQKEMHQITVNAAQCKPIFSSNQRPANHPNIIDALVEPEKQSQY
jgi:hypothetical protein